MNNKLKFSEKDFTSINFNKKMCDEILNARVDKNFNLSKESNEIIKQFGYISAEDFPDTILKELFWLLNEEISYVKIISHKLKEHTTFNTTYDVFTCILAKIKNKLYLSIYFDNTKYLEEWQEDIKQINEAITKINSIYQKVKLKIENHLDLVKIIN